MIQPLSALPELPVEELRTRCLEAVSQGARLAALFSPDGRQLFAALARGTAVEALTARTEGAYPALTPALPAAQAFERDLFEEHGLRPLGHPWLKPLRRAYRETDFYRVHGAQVHEVAVGPVHAGVIEPGHFRFQCNGEHVLHLEIALGYQHRGVEQGLRGGPHKRTMALLETLAGDTSVGHALAGCQLIEELAGCQPSARARALRELALELERLANHVGDLGALAGDVAFLPTASYCGRLRGAFLNLTAELCGSRFGRGLVRPGGVRARLPEPGFGERLALAVEETRQAVELMLESSWVRARFEDTGRLTRAQALELGLVGPAARASGVELDLRGDPCLQSTGDVDARARVRWLEVRASAARIAALLSGLPEGELQAPVGSLAPEHLAVALVEGWRGAICHAAVTDAGGRFQTYKVVDPSLLNWMGLAVAMRGQEISDFPLCNKSFNLSYCGHDL